MRNGLRVRLAVALLAGLLLGWFYVAWAWHLALNLQHHVLENYVDCTPGFRQWGSPCTNQEFTSTPALLLLLVVSAVALGGLLALVRWTLLPVRQLARTVGRFGPQNLGERTGATGRRDELTRLATEVDAMLERVAEGYDGQRRFASNASHELRTPLAVQRTLIEVGLAGDPTPEQLTLLARQLLQTNERNENLIEGLLVLAESDQGLRSRTPQPLHELAEATVALHADAARAAGVTLLPELGPVTVDGEAALLERLLTNLVGNGIKYNEPGGWVTVRVGPGSPVLTVENTGPQVPATAVPRLFEPFRRLRGDRLDHSGGAGLGLTIVRSIATAHDGYVDAVARPDGGLSVRVELPQP